MLLAEADATRDVWQARKLYEDRTYPLVPPGSTAPQYEPTESVAEIGDRTGRTGLEVMLDVMCEDEGQGLLNYPHYNFIHGNLDAVRAMMTDPGVRVGLSDAGAHLETLATPASTRSCSPTGPEIATTAFRSKMSFASSPLRLLPCSDWTIAV